MTNFEDYLFSIKPWASLIAIILAFVIWKILLHFARKTVLRPGTKNTAREGTVQIIMNLIKYSIAIISVFLVLEINGVNITTFTAGLGIASVVVGFSLQDFLNDWVMGASIVWDGYFNVGDVIEYDNQKYRVIHFNFKTTKLQNLENNNLLVISNRHLSSVFVISNILNVDISAPYDVPADRMRQICQTLASEFARIPDVTKTEFQGTQAFEASNILYRIKIVCPAAKRVVINREANGIIQDVFAKEGISIPYNQLDVHLINPSSQIKKEP